MSRGYSFRMTWRFEAPIETVWDMLNRPENWPQWWRNCRKVEKLVDGEAGGVGSVRRFSMQTQLPYTLRFDIRTAASEPPRLIEGDVGGQLEGTVRWELSQDGAITDVLYFWDVAPTRAWMRMLSPLLRPAFVWNHRAVMKNGAKGLSRMMDVPLVYEEYR